jgi:hypothetical protein
MANNINLGGNINNCGNTNQIFTGGNSNPLNVLTSKINNPNAHIFQQQMAQAQPQNNNNSNSNANFDSNSNLFKPRK